MKTMLFWHQNKPPKDWEEENWGDLTENFFECPRLFKGDRIELEIKLSDGGIQFYIVKVASVEIGICYEAMSQDDFEVTQTIHVRG